MKARIGFNLQVTAMPALYSLNDWSYQTIWVFSGAPDDPQDKTVMENNRAEALYSAVKSLMHAIWTKDQEALWAVAHQITQIGKPSMIRQCLELKGAIGNPLWAKSLAVYMKVNVIHYWADLLRELSTMHQSLRAAPYHDQNHPPISQPSPIIFWKPPEATKYPHPETKMSATPFSESLFSLPLAGCLSPSNTPSTSLMLWPYFPLAPMYYPSHTSLSILLRLPNWFCKSLAGHLRLIWRHTLCLCASSVPLEGVAARRPWNRLCCQVWACWWWLSHKLTFFLRDLVQWRFHLFGEYCISQCCCVSSVHCGGLTLAFVIGKHYVSKDPYALAVMAGSTGSHDGLPSAIRFSLVWNSSCVAAPKKGYNHSTDSWSCKVFADSFAFCRWRSPTRSTSKGCSKPISGWWGVCFVDWCTEEL